ncbi:MAG: ABC transporter permease subunit [bacterium]|nr:ABC transporter permease subunit [bacterium]
MRKKRKSLWRRVNENTYIQATSGLLLPMAFGVILFALWQTEVLHKIFHTDTFTLPVPTRILSVIVDNPDKVIQNVVATVTVAVIGLVIGSVIGYLVAIIATLFPRWGGGGLSIVAACNAIPIVALAPVMTNWTKDVSKDANIRSMVAKTLVVMIICIASMSVNAYRGLTELKPFSLDLMKSYNAKRRTVFFKLRIPNSVPYIFTALRVSIPASVITAVVSEYFAEYVIGVGRQIRENIVLAQYTAAWGYITVASLIGIVMYVILMIAERILLRRR